LIECSVTWPRWGTMRNGACSERTMPVLRTSANESGLWPTPVADGDRATNYAQGGTSLGFAVRNWPTPTAHTSVQIRGVSQWAGKNTKRGTTLAGAVRVKNWPTPTASDSAGGGSQWSKTQMTLTTAVLAPEGVRLEETRGGGLNPTWVEWLMGWPLGWTDFAPLETAKFQQWRRSHGRH
jgi:hypothetical protein